MLISNNIEHLIQSINESNCSTFIYSDDETTIPDTDIKILMFSLSQCSSIEDLKTAFGFVLTASVYKHAIIKSIFSTLLTEKEIGYFISLVSLINFYNNLVKKSEQDMFALSKMPSGYEIRVGFSTIVEDGDYIKLTTDDLDEHGVEFKNKTFMALYYNYLQYIRKEIADTIEISIDNLNNDNLGVFRMMID